MIRRIFVPTDTVEDWKRFLADPEKQWRDGYSAKSTAEHWENSNGLPADIRMTLQAAGLTDTKLLIAIPEWKTALPGGRRESQTDVFALIQSKQGLIVSAIEAKVAEPFGPTVDQWLRNASDGKRIRLDHLTDLLGLNGEIGHLRYQLLHRTASALIEAENFSGFTAAMIVQSFHEKALWKEDLSAFAEAMGLTVGVLGKIRAGANLLLGWSSPASV